MLYNRRALLITSAALVALAALASHKPAAAKVQPIVNLSYTWAGTFTDTIPGPDQGGLVLVIHNAGPSHINAKGTFVYVSDPHHPAKVNSLQGDISGPATAPIFTLTGESKDAYVRFYDIVYQGNSFSGNWDAAKKSDHNTFIGRGAFNVIKQQPHH